MQTKSPLETISNEMYLLNINVSKEEQQFINLKKQIGDRNSLDETENRELINENRI